MLDTMWIIFTKWNNL